MGKNWVYSIALTCASVGLTVVCALDATPLAAEENPLSKYLSPLSKSSGKTSSAFGIPSKKTVPLSQRVTGAIGSFTRRSAEFLTPKPRVIRATDPLSLSAKSPPPTVELFISMAWASERHDKLAKQEEFYKKALDVDSKNVDALSGYANLLDRQERFREATRLYLQITGRHPDRASAHNDLGLCYARQSMLSEAIESLERAISLQPRRMLYRNNIATILIEVGRTPEALGHLTAVHDEAIAHYNVGYLLHMQGDDRRAVSHFSAALQSNPSLAVAQNWFDRLGGQSAHQIASKPIVEITDLPDVEETQPEEFAVRRVVPEPTQNPPYRQQHGSTELVDPSEPSSFAWDHPETPPASSPPPRSSPAVLLPPVPPPLASPLPAARPPTTTQAAPLPTTTQAAPLPAAPRRKAPLPIAPSPAVSPTSTPLTTAPRPTELLPIAPLPIAPLPSLSAPSAPSRRVPRQTAPLPSVPLPISPSPSVSPRSAPLPVAPRRTAPLPIAPSPSAAPQVPIKPSSGGLSGQDDLPPSPDQVYGYWKAATPVPLPPVPKN